MPRVSRFLLGTSAIGGAALLYDSYFQQGAAFRTLYAVSNATVVGIDYKLNFREGRDIDALHKRNAKRLYRVITHNKGLYVKIGQSIAIQGNMLPPPYLELLTKLYDDAPMDTWEECEKTLNESLNGDYTQVFSEFNRTPVASASIAQVHKAKLRSNGEEVAVKIQHRDIPQTTKWDLNTYKAIVWFMGYFVFKMPMYPVASYIATQVGEETDFRIEKKNTEVMRELVSKDKDTRGKVYVPEIFSEFSNKTILTMEWIEGISLSQPEQVVQNNYNTKEALNLVFTTLTKEAFDWGVVHSDPHPGNWILRRDPKTKKQQLVMLDHGLYVYMGEKLRQEYAQLWRAMFKRDLPTITRITESWGFGDPKLFASATMLQPYDERDAPKKDFKQNEEDAERFRSFLKDTEKLPLQLIFVGRTQRILQGLNQLYGSPVNRMHILVDAALKVPQSATEVGANWRYPWTYVVLDYVYRRLLLLVADLTYTLLRIKQFFTKEDPELALDQTLQQQGTNMVTK